MKVQNNKTAKSIKKNFLVTIVVALIGTLFKTTQIIVFFNRNTGLINNTVISNIFNFIVLICFLFIVARLFLLSIKILPTTEHFNIGTPRFVGYILFFTTLLFVLQGVIDLSSHIMDYYDISTKIQYLNLSPDEKKLMLFPLIYSIVIDVFCLLSALSFYVLAMEYVRQDEKKHLFLYLIPVIWSTLVLINIIISVPNVVSYQTTYEKSTLMTFAILFLYYISYWACGYESKKKTAFSVFFRVSFSIVTSMFVIPYLIAFIFRIKDSIVNIPYLALFGLLVYGFIVMLQFLAGSCSYINKK